jgi:hypothetical protein
MLGNGIENFIFILNLVGGFFQEWVRMMWTKNYVWHNKYWYSCWVILVHHCDAEDGQKIVLKVIKL